MEFTEWINKIGTSIIDFLNFILEIPDFIIGFLQILPMDLQAIILSALGLLSILLIYRFIK